MAQKSKIEFAKGKLVNFGGKAKGVGPIQSFFEVVGPLSDKIAALMDVKSSVFTPKGTVKPGFKEMKLDFEGADAYLKMDPPAEMKGLNYQGEVRRVSRVSLTKTGGNKPDKPAFVKIKMRLDLPVGGDTDLLAFEHFRKCGSGDMRITIEFVQVEQTKLPLRPAKSAGC